jgi:hypothetical protein
MENINTYSIICNFIMARRHDEKEYVLRIFDLELEEKLFEELKNIQSIIERSDIGHLSILGEVEIDVDISGEYKELYDNLNISVKIEKKQNDTLCFFTEKGLENYLLTENALDNIRHIKIFFSGQSFKSKSVFFEGINNDKNDITFPKLEKINTAKYVRPLNVESQKLLPHDINLWLTDEKIESCNLLAWKRISTYKLFVTLCSEIFIENDHVELLFRGDRRKSINIDVKKLLQFQDLFYCINKCTNWIYGESKDVDTRHTMFNNQIISLISSDNVTYEKNSEINILLENTLENAKLTYRYYLQNTSKELSKTLTDLNKTLFDYVGRIRQNTVELVNNIWKDLTTVLGLLMLNFSIKKPDLPESFFDFLGYGLSIYLAFSIFLNARMSFWYYKSLISNLSDWRTKIYSYLGDEDWNKYALLPLKSAQGKYKMTFFFAIGLYFVMISAVLIFTMDIDLLKFLRLK